MPRFITLAAVSALGLAVAGCATQPGALRPANNTSVYSLHQPVVEHTNFVFDLTVAGDSLPASEQERLAAWLDSIEIGYGDRLAVDEPQGYPSTGARQDVARVAARYGLLLVEGAPVTAGAVDPGTIRVIASRSHASVPGCPLWADDGSRSTAATSTNYGCATNSNLAAMIANPDDLVHGREGSSTRSATTAGRAIRTYREGQPTGRQGLTPTSTTGR